MTALYRRTAPLILPYIDDLNSILTDKRHVEDTTRAILTAASRAGLPVAPEKTVWAGSTSSSEALGLCWWDNEVLPVKPVAIEKLVELSLSALDGGSLSPREMQRLIGIWTWPCFLKRPFLSVFGKVYDLAKAPRPHRKLALSADQKSELRQIFELLPMLFLLI